MVTTMHEGPLLTPLAEDCDVLRRALLADPLPRVWQLDAESARRLHREGVLAARAAWQPPVDELAVVVDELAPEAGVPAIRRYRRDGHEAALAETVVVWLHGGGWVLGDLDTADAAARTICDLSGWMVLSVDYRCAPVDRFPTAVDDSLAALDWALERYPRVVVAGDSAGGNLAGVAAQLRGGHPSLVGQVLIYPTSDPRLESRSAREFVEGPFLTRRDMEWFYEQYLARADDYDSPLVDLARAFGTRSVTPVPAVILTVGHDPLRDEGIEYARLLAESGFEVTWIHAPDLYHGAYSNSGLLPTAEARVREVWSAAHRMFI